MLSKADLERIAQGFKYVAEDPTAHHSTVVKMITEFDNAAESRTRDSIASKHDRAHFHSLIFGQGREVLNPWNMKRIECKGCGYDLFWDRGRSLDTYNHECQRCFHMNHTMTETGMSR